MCAAVVAVALLASRATAEPLRTRSDAVCRNAAGAELALPAGWYLYSPEDRVKIDTALRAAEDRRTHLEAENARLRSTGGGGGSALAAVAIISIAIAGGAGLGWYARGAR